MARYGKEHKEATRRRIVEAAGRRFKRDGIDGSGIATLMADAGLTNGAFYAHFDSKEDLVATTVADQLREQRESYWQRPGAGVEQLVREYLSVRHRDDPEHGCPSAALLDEIGRCPTSTKQAYTDGVLAIADEIAARLAPDDPESARATTLSLFALLIGTLQLSRALADRQLAACDQVLHELVHPVAAGGGAGCGHGLPPRVDRGVVARLRRAAALPRRCRSGSGPPTPVRPVKGQGGLAGAGENRSAAEARSPGRPALRKPLTEQSRCGTHRPRADPHDAGQAQRAGALVRERPLAPGSAEAGGGSAPRPAGGGR